MLDVDSIYAHVSSLTMVSRETLDFTWKQTVARLAAGSSGYLVECGVWRGGCSFGMALAQRAAFGRVREPVYMFDSFQGLPDATERDGPAAFRYQADVMSPRYYDNCRANEPGLVAARAALGLSDAECVIASGWFEDTFPVWRELFAERGILVLRIDCDWYASVRYALEQFGPLVRDEGLVLIDDYYAWDGCARALHDYLSYHDHTYRIRSLPDASSVYYVPQEARSK